MRNLPNCDPDKYKIIVLVEWARVRASDNVFIADHAFLFQGQLPPTPTPIPCMACTGM